MNVSSKIKNISENCSKFPSGLDNIQYIPCFSYNSNFQASTAELNSIKYLSSDRRLFKLSFKTLARCLPFSFFLDTKSKSRTQFYSKLPPCGSDFSVEYSRVLTVAGKQFFRQTKKLCINYIASFAIPIPFSLSLRNIFENNEKLGFKLRMKIKGNREHFK